MKSNKTYLIYSKKNSKFISSIEDISSIVFVKYGFNILYSIDVINIIHSIRRKFYIFALILILYYTFSPYNIAIQIISMLSFGLLAYIIEIFFLKQKQYFLIGTIEARNSTEARENFIKDKIFNKNINIPTNTVFIKI